MLPFSTKVGRLLGDTKRKGKMKKIVLILVSAVFLIGIFATAQEVASNGSENESDKISPEVRAVIENVAPEMSEKVKPEVSKFIEDFVDERGIKASEINDIKQVDFNALPKEVNIENVGDHNLAIYEVDYNNTKGPDKLYVVSYSLEQLRGQGDLIIAHDKREFLTFGHAGQMNSSGFINTAAGVETSLEKGYVMVRDGSITAISTNLEVLLEAENGIEIIVYKNGEPISFGNTLESTVGVKKDYDVQSKGTVEFQAGDVISVYVKNDNGASWNDVTTLVEITSDS